MGERRTTNRRIHSPTHFTEPPPTPSHPTQPHPTSYLLINPIPPPTSHPIHPTYPQEHPLPSVPPRAPLLLGPPKTRPRLLPQAPPRRPLPPRAAHVSQESSLHPLRPALRPRPCRPHPCLERVCPRTAPVQRHVQCRHTHPRALRRRHQNKFARAPLRAAVPRQIRRQP